MKKLIFIVLFYLVSCSINKGETKLIIVEEELLEADDNYNMYYLDELFTGIAVSSFDRDFRIMHYYKNGLSIKDEVWLPYPDTLRAVSLPKKSGGWIHKYFHKNGNISRVSQTDENDNYDGHIFELDEKGDTTYTQNFKHGIPLALNGSGWDIKIIKGKLFAEISKVPKSIYIGKENGITVDDIEAMISYKAMISYIEYKDLNDSDKYLLYMTTTTNVNLMKFNDIENIFELEIESMSFDTINISKVDERDVEIKLIRK